MIHDDQLHEAIRQAHADAESDPNWQDRVHRRIDAGEHLSARPWWQERICLVAAGLAVWSLFSTAGLLWLWRAIDVQQQRAAACEARRP